MPNDESASSPVIELDLASLQSATINGIPGHLKDYVMTHITRYQERSFWNHQYIVVRYRGRTSHSSVIFVRVERDKTEWLDVWSDNLEQKISASTTERVLTANSDRVTDDHISPEVAEKSRVATLPSLGSLIEALQAHSPRYTFPTYNCWWFASCVYHSVMSRVADETPTPRAWRRPLGVPSWQPAVDSSSDHYFRTQRGYWKPLGWILLFIILILSLWWNWMRPADVDPRSWGGLLWFVDLSVALLSSGRFIYPVYEIM